MPKIGMGRGGVLEGPPLGTPGAVSPPPYLIDGEATDILSSRYKERISVVTNDLGVCVDYGLCTIGVWFEKHFNI